MGYEERCVVRKKLLVIEDNQRVLEILAFALGREGYQVIRASNGLTGLRLVEERRPDLVLIDLTRTEPDSFKTCLGVREAGIETPVILFLSSEEQAWRLSELGLNAAHIQKPFKMRELLMQIKVNTWEMDASGESEVASPLFFGRIVIDPAQALVTKDDLPVELTQLEYNLLYYLAMEPGRVFSREELLKKVWECSYMGDTRNVPVYISRLREKIEDDPIHPKTIITRRGRGYTFTGQT